MMVPEEAENGLALAVTDGLRRENVSGVLSISYFQLIGQHVPYIQLSSQRPEEVTARAGNESGFDTIALMLLQCFLILPL